MLIEHWQKIAHQTGPAPDSAPTIPLAATLDALAVVRFAGADVENFLQGYLTRDLAELHSGEPCLAALTNIKGRVVASGWCLSSAEGQIDWIVHGSLIERIAAFMKPYLAFSRTSLSQLVTEHLIVGLIEADGTPSIQLVEDIDGIDTLSERYAFGGAVDWHAARLRAGVALITDATSESFLPQMLGLVAAGAVDFDKGCYLGQEVVARAQHRGEVKRQLTLLSGDCAALTPGMPLTGEDDRQLGTVIESAPSTCVAVVKQPPADVYLGAGNRLSPLNPH